MKSKLPSILKVILSQRSISQRKLANDSGVPLSSINGMLAGKKSYSTDNLISVADTLKVSLDYLLTGKAGATASVDEIPSTILADGVYRIKLERLHIPGAKKKREDEID